MDSISASNPLFGARTQGTPTTTKLGTPTEPNLRETTPNVFDQKKAQPPKTKVKKPIQKLRRTTKAR